MDKEKLITDVNNLAVDFWTMNLHNGTFESHLRNLLNEYEQAVNFAHSSTQLKEKLKMCFGDWKLSEGLTLRFAKYVDKKNNTYTIDEVDKMYDDYYNL